MCASAPCICTTIYGSLATDPSLPASSVFKLYKLDNFGSLKIDFVRLKIVDIARKTKANMEIGVPQLIRHHNKTSHTGLWTTLLQIDTNHILRTIPL